MAPLELATAGTDALLAAAVIAGAEWLRRAVPASPARNLWVAAFMMLGFAALAGGGLHAVRVSGGDVGAFWRPLYALMGMAFVLILLGTIGAWRGDRASGRMLVPALIACAIYFAATWHLENDENVLRGIGIATIVPAMLMFGVIALDDSSRRRGAATASGGLLLMALAGMGQAETVRVTLGALEFDQNSLAHIVMIASMAAITVGVRATLSPSTGARRTQVPAASGRSAR